MRIVIPPPRVDVRVASALFNGQAFFISGLGILASAGNGHNATDYGITGGQWSIQGGTITDSWALRGQANAPDSAGLGAPHQLWLLTMAQTFRPLQILLSVEGAVTMGLGDFRGTGDYTIFRTNTTSKRIVLHIERNAAGIVTAYFLCCNGAVLQQSVVTLPDAVKVVASGVAKNQRITVAFRPGIAAELWYDNTRILQYTNSLPTGAPTNIWGSANVVHALRLHRRVFAGASFQRFDTQGLAVSSIDL